MRLLRIAVWILLVTAAASCVKKPRVSSLPPALTPVPSVVTPPAPAVTLPVPESTPSTISLPEPPPPPAVPPTLVALAEGDKAFELGEYGRAAQHYENYLTFIPNAPDRDRVLYRLAMSYMLPEPPARDWNKGMQKLKQIVSDYPTSPYQPAALVMMRLHDNVGSLLDQKQNLERRIESLQRDLIRLKEIDEQGTRRD